MLDRFHQVLIRISLMGYERLEVAIRKKFGLPLLNTFQLITRFVALYTPMFLVRFIPAWLSSICSSYLLSSYCFSYLLSSSSHEKRFYAWLRNLEEISVYRKVLLHRKAHFLSRYSETEQLLSFLEEMQKNSDQGVFVNQWIYFNFKQDRMISHFQTTKLRLASSDEDRFDSQLRYLPDHTRHMGHLGFLFLYNYFYSKNDPNRTIAIWPHLAPNAFYLKKLLESSPLEYKIMPRESWGNSISEIQEDTIMISRISKSVWRFEPIIAAGTGQEFPEFDIDETSLLRSDITSHEISQKELVSIGFDPKRWFVILHIKEDGLGYLVSGETRDASIYDYLPACCVVRDLGGQVVRMGSPSFPKLSKSFPAIDYAHSRIRSDFIDYWLWANCSSWIGNCNGASVAVIPFGKPRLVTNQWPIEPNGPSKDFVLPKLAYSEKRNKYLSFSETVESELGRSMSRSLLIKNGLKLIDNPPQVIASSLLQLIRRETTPQLNSDFHRHDFELHSATKTPAGTPRMRLTESYKQFYDTVIP